MIPKPPAELILFLYGSGLSIRQVANKLGVSKSVVFKIVKGMRGQSEAARLRQPATSRHWRSSRAEARRVWIRTNGPIPTRYHIHHKDGDYTNNKIENLEMVDPRTHAHIHRPPNPIPRGLRPERQQYMRNYRANHKTHTM